VLMGDFHLSSASALTAGARSIESVKVRFGPPFLAARGTYRAFARFAFDEIRRQHRSS
jgi:hypothetical protein